MIRFSWYPVSVMVKVILMNILDEAKDYFKHGVEVGSNPNLTANEAISQVRNEASMTLSKARELNIAKQERKTAVAKRLSALRDESGQKQQIVAKEIGINTVTLSGYEIGKSEPNLEVLVRLADFYKVSLDFLLCRTDTRIQFNKEEYAARDQERKEMQAKLEQLANEVSNLKDNMNIK